MNLVRFARFVAQQPQIQSLRVVTGHAVDEKLMLSVRKALAAKPDKPEKLLMESKISRTDRSKQSKVSSSQKKIPINSVFSSKRSVARSKTTLQEEEIEVDISTTTSKKKSKSKFSRSPTRVSRKSEAPQEKKNVTRLYDTEFSRNVRPEESQIDRYE